MLEMIPICVDTGSTAEQPIFLNSIDQTFQAADKMLGQQF